jgi:cyclase
MQHIKDNVYADLISPGCNVGILATPKGSVIVDTPLVARQARAINRELAAEGHAPVRFIVITHAHGDHILGTGLFGDDVLVFGNQPACERMEAHRPSWVRNWVATWSWDNPADIEEMVAARIVRPNVVFDTELTLRLGGVEIWILPLPGHLAESVGVLVPAAGVLIAGDALFCEHHPYIGDANLQIWLKSLEKMRTLGAQRFIPGHGPVCGLEAIEHQRRYMEKMLEVRSRWNPADGEKSLPGGAVEELLGFYPLHGRPQAVMRARVIESIRVAGEPQFEAQSVK